MKRILIVDDEAAFLFGIKRVIEGEDTLVETVETLDCAYSLLEKQAFDAAVVDVRLSGTGGEEGLEILKHIKDSGCRTNVIILTAYGNQDVKQRAYDAGADLYLEKPLSPDVLRESLYNFWSQETEAFDGHEIKRLSDGDLEIAFQPIINIASNRIYGFEALLRGVGGKPVNNPGPLFCSPGCDDESLSNLDMSCIGSALKFGKDLTSSHMLFINIHAGTVKRLTAKWDSFLGVINDLQINPEAVVFELSERTDYACVSSMLASIDKLHKAGIRIAIDDVKDNFRWLHHMLNMRPHFIKIDRSCVENINRHVWKQGMLEGFASMTSKMGVQVIAEGIESDEELATVRNVGVQFGQGFLFSHPKPAGNWLPPSKEWLYDRQ